MFMPQCHRAVLSCNTAACSLFSPKIPEGYVQLLLSRSVSASVPFAGGAIINWAKRLARAALFRVG